jgi:arylsulfatase A-like enzyme
MMATKKTATRNSEQPNILVISGDDIGIASLSCYSHRLLGYKTPNIDRLATEGMLFTDSTVSSRVPPGGRRSSPARAAFAPASPRSACPEPMSACRPRTRRSPSC